MFAVLYLFNFNDNYSFYHEFLLDTFSWNDRMTMTIDITSVLETFHYKGLVHVGVNSKNIVVNKVV